MKKTRIDKNTKTPVKSFLTKKIIIGYSMGQLGWALLAGLIASQLTVVWTGVGAKGSGWDGFISIPIFAAVFAATKLVDAFSAPLVGRISDKLDTKWGRRIPLMAIAILPFAIVSVLAFVGLSDKKNDEMLIANIAFLVIMLTLFYMCLSVYMIPFTALISDLGRTSEERVALSTYNAITFFLGTLIAYTAPIIWNVFHNTFDMSYRSSFIIAIGLLSFVAIIFMLIPVKIIKEKKWMSIVKKNAPLRAQAYDRGFFKSIGEVFRDKQFRLVILADFFLWIGLIGFQTQMNNFVIAILGLKLGNTIFFAGVSGLVSFALFPLIAKWMNKVGVRKNIVQIGFVTYCIVFLYGAVMMMNRDQAGHVMAWVNGMILVIIVGFPTAIMGVVKNVIISDVIQTNAVVHGEDKAATYFAVRNFTSKIGMAIGLGVAVGLLSLGKSVDSPWGVRSVMIFAAVTSVLGFISLSFYKEIKYRMNKEFFKFLKAETKRLDLESKLQKARKEKNSDLILTYSTQVKEAMQKEKELYDLSKSKADKATKSILIHILKKKEHIKKASSIARLEKDIKAYNVIRKRFSLNSIDKLEI